MRVSSRGALASRGSRSSPGSFASSTHLVCFLVREQRELLERAGQRGAPASRALLVRNVHGGARHDGCLSLRYWFCARNPAGASVTSRRLRRAAGCVSGGQRVNFGGGREERTVGAFERVRGASSRVPEPGPGRSRLEKRASAKRETLVSD